MRHTRFVANDSLWREILSHVRDSGPVLVAIAYFGSGGAELLPLKRGDRLVVDMSLQAVKQGATNPAEIRKLLQRGVKVFSRGALHAKFIVAGKTLIASSANVSSNSKNQLDEAGIITSEAMAVARARAFFEALCTEPIRPEYLKQCIKAYNPPKFKAMVARNGGAGARKRVVQARVWFLGGLKNLNLPEHVKKSIARVERKAERKLRRPQKTSVTWVRFEKRPKFLDYVRDGDWVIECTTDGGPRYVTAPAQVLYQDQWISPRGKTHEMLMLECLNDGAEMPLSRFRKRIRRFEPKLDNENPRTRAIENDEHADLILRLWTPSGRLRRS
jgi:hypothetical protein